MAEVYVSSTIADLKRERRAVMNWLVAAGHQVVHSYRPNSETVRDSCLADVDISDLYVLILGHRYGAQPIDNNPEGLSSVPVPEDQNVQVTDIDVGQAAVPHRFAV